MDPEFLLIKRMKQGDEKAFDIFVRKYYDDITGLLRPPSARQTAGGGYDSGNVSPFFLRSCGTIVIWARRKTTFTRSPAICAEIFTEKKKSFRALTRLFAGAPHEYAASYRDHEGDRARKP